MRWYYSLWADAIGFEKAKHGHIRNWKLYVIIGITFCQGLNIATVLLLLSNWVNTSFFLPINIFPGQMIDGALSGIITLFLLPMLLNYFLVIRSGRYEKIVRYYPFRKGKLYIRYFLLSLMFFLLPVAIGFILSRT